MKRVLFSLVWVVFMVAGYAGVTMSKTEKSPELPIKKPCTGYEVIEAGKGLNCNGDTINLIKRSGFYEIAGNF